MKKTIIDTKMFYPIVYSVIYTMLYTMFALLVLTCAQGFAMDYYPGENEFMDENLQFDRKYWIVSEYGDMIAKASGLFAVPQEIILGVIINGSPKNPLAFSSQSRGRGLMQTSDKIFQRACKTLRKKGIKTTENPYDPEASIMAGTWHLDRLYRLAVVDFNADPDKRHLLSSWKYPLEYYHSGPFYSFQKFPIKDYHKIHGLDKGFD
jgi:hypothetical protein